MPNWNPGHVNGHASRGWGKSNEAGMAQERDACWAVGKGENHPVSLAPLTAEEKEVRLADSANRKPLNLADSQ
jgi:PERQ amino acid-rich with GYF domain-containing protein